MSNKIVYSLDFRGNTSDVQGQLDRLKQSMDALVSKKFTLGSSAKTELKEAASLVQDFQKHMEFAFDPSTGKADPTRLATSMKNLNQTGKTYGTTMSRAGKEGTQAFLNMGLQIANAQQSTIRLNGMMSNLWTTLKNTARWQISSAVLSGFTRSISSAVSFAKELNT